MNSADITNPNLPPEPPFVPAMDAILLPDEAAKWLRYDSVEKLMDAARRGRVPMMKLGHRTPRFHVRTVLKKLRQETQ